MLAHLAPLYPDPDRPYRTGLHHPRFAQMRVLVGDERGWYFLTMPGA